MPAVPQSQLPHQYVFSLKVTITLQVNSNSSHKQDKPLQSHLETLNWANTEAMDSRKKNVTGKYRRSLLNWYSRVSSFKHKIIYFKLSLMQRDVYKLICWTVFQQWRHPVVCFFCLFLRPLKSALLLYWRMQIIFGNHKIPNLTHFIFPLAFRTTST